MKRITMTFLFSMAVLFIVAQNTVQPRVDERTELLSIVFRLAGSKEYNYNNIPSYAKEIDEYFSPFKEHVAIKFAQKVRNENGVSYDAVMSLAVILEISDSVRLNPDITLKTLDNRWTLENVKAFTLFLNQFYADTKFSDFYKKHRSLYKKAEDKFSTILNKVDFSWFEKFYGEKQKGNFNLVLSIPNGPGNYGPKVIFNNGKEDLYAIIGCCVADSTGQPSYPESTRSIVIHEYNHSFCNPLMEANYPAMQSKSDDIFKLVKEKMSKQAYGTSKTMNYEILVRACVIKYFQRRKENDEYVKSMIINEKDKGFLWIEQLVDQLSIYEKNRDKYPTMKDFMPEIVKLQNNLSLEVWLKEMELSYPKIVSMSIENNSTTVDPNTKEIILRFDRPMSVRNNGVGYGKSGKDYFPEFPKDRKCKWNEETKKEWIMQVDLKPDSSYSLSFDARWFKSENGYLMDKTYYLDFKTAKE
jgi:hypothetical protein